MRPIDADALMKEFAKFVAPSNNSDFADVPTWNDAVSLVGSAPTIDAVPVGAYEQTRWERDTAIEQLAEIGKSLCEKMDNVATVVRCKDCKEYIPWAGDYICGRVGSYWGNTKPDDFCSFGERSDNGVETETNH